MTASTAAPTDATARPPAGFFQTTVGLKVVMAVTGLIMFGYLVGHVAGNLQVFGEPARINDYAAFLHHSLGILWGTRALLLVSVIAHIRSAVVLYSLKARARGLVPYTKKGERGSTLFSRIMIWTGYLLAAFIVYHILHFTTGTLHNDFTPGDVHRNMVVAFHQPLVVIIYVASMIFLSFHLQHGLFSLTQSLGLSHARYSAAARSLSVVIGILLASAFGIIPIGLALGLAGG
jgi:succinate dehydrogenase / fumarate reductase cytochrome b subunit